MCRKYCYIRYRPVDVKRGAKGVSRTTAKYAIRSGPKQFAAYINGK